MSSGVDTSDIDELLERVRSLQRLLPSPTTEQEHLPSIPNIPTSTNRSNTSHRTNHVRITTHNENVPADPEIGPKETFADQLAEESLDLLKQVTFIRIVVDRLNWQRVPEFFKKEFGGHKSPRDRGQLIVEYQLPSTEGSYQTLKKRIRVFAKNVIPSVAHFNHRRVALLQMNASLLHLWSKASIWFRVMIQLPGSGQVRQIGRAHLALEQVLLVPFSVETELNVDVSQNEVGAGSATLKVSVQLGSRHSSFTDRVEQLRNNILGESPRESRYHLLDPIRISNKFGVDPPPPATAHQTACSTAAAVKSKVDQQYLRPERTIPVIDPPIRVNEQPNYLDRRESCGLVLSGGNAASRGDRAVEVGVQSHEWKSTSSQTEAHSKHGTPKPPENKAKSRERNISVQTSDTPEIISLEANGHNTSSELDVSRNRGHTRHETVADRLRRTRSSDSKGDQLYEITVHSASNLPYVKGSHGEAIQPNVYVSYRGDHEQVTSNTIARNSKPIWNWKSQFGAKHNRKTIVLKVWHACPERGARVLGFVCLDLSAVGKDWTSGDYDLVDLSQSSTGTIRVTMRMLDCYTDLMEESMFAMPSHKMNEDVGVNTSFLPPPPMPNPRSSPLDPYLELASRSFLADKLKINMNELDQMLIGLRPSATNTYRNC